MLFIVTVVVLLLDQITKALVILYLSLHKSVPIIPEVFYLTFVKNPGAAFGLFAYQTPFFIAVTLLVLVALLLFYCSTRVASKSMQWGLALLAGGALGNLTDRLRMGYVVDFIDFRIWPVFNLADTAIVVGVIIVCWGLLNSSVKDDQKEVKR